VSAVYLLEIDGDEVEVLKDSLDLDLQANWQSTLQCQIPVDLLGSPIARPEARSDVVLKRDGTPIFGGILTQAPEEGFGGPNLDQVVFHISAVGYSTYFTYRYVNITFAAGITLKTAITSLVAYLPTGFTLDPGQVDGPNLTQEFIFNQTRLDEILKALTSDTGYLPEITPAKLFHMVSPASVPAPFDLLDTGPVYQIGDVKVERTLDDSYANRILIAIEGAGPATSTEYYEVPGTTWSYTTKYPASQSVMDLWPNELWVLEPGGDPETDWIPYGPIGYGASPITHWDPVTHTLVYTGTGGIPPTGSLIRIAYAIGYPFFVTGNDLADQALHPIKEAFESLGEAMTLEAAQAYADYRASLRAATLTRVLYQTEEPGLLPGMSQTITLAARAVDATCLITEVKLCVPAEHPGSEPVYDITALVGSTEHGNVRQVYKDWLYNNGRSATSLLQRTGAGTEPGQPVRSVQYHGPQGQFSGDQAFTFVREFRSLICGDLSTIAAFEAESCQVFGYDCHIVDA
jgi:hypothetical protein